MKLILLCSITAAVALWGPGALSSTSAAACQSTVEEQPLYIAIGDRLRVTDAFHPEEMAASERVRIDGTVFLPELGAVQVAGLTEAEVQTLLMEKYSEYYDLLDIRVRIDSQHQRELEGDLTVCEAVLLNRPDLRSAHLGRVRLIRPDPRDPLVLTLDSEPGVPELLARAVAGMEGFAHTASPEGAQAVQELIETVQAASAEFKRIARRAPE